MTGPELLGQWVQSRHGEIGQVAVYDAGDHTCTYAVTVPDGSIRLPFRMPFRLSKPVPIPGWQVLPGLPERTPLAWVSNPMRILTPEEIAAVQLARLGGGL